MKINIVLVAVTLVLGSNTIAVAQERITTTRTRENASPELAKAQKTADQRLKSLDEFLKKFNPDSPEEMGNLGQANKEHSDWIQTVKTRMLTARRELVEKMKGRSNPEFVNAMATMSMQFLALQNAVQNESRKFQTLSNASKARHDIAMNAIRNMK